MADTTRPAAPILTSKPDVGERLEWSGVSDNVGVVKQELWLDGEYVRELGRTTRTVLLRPGPGIHIARVVAYDAAGNLRNSNNRSFTIVDSIVQPPDPGQPPAPPPPTNSIFKTVAVDEQFATLDETRWSPYGVRGGTTPGHAGNGYRDPNCLSIRGDVVGATGTGCLVGTAFWDAAAKKLRAPAMALRQDFLSFRVECRARVEKDPSGVTAANMPLLWPGIYSDADYEEVNPYETSGPFNPARGMSAFWHFGVVRAGFPAADQEYYDLGVDGSQWHTMAYERENGTRESCWVDGVLKKTITDPNILAKRAHHPCLQLDAINGGNPGQAIHMYVDSLRVLTK